MSDVLKRIRTALRGLGRGGRQEADPLTRARAVLAERYAIEREIGSGGMATVYLARDLKHDRAVAVKVMRADLSAALGRERFLREIRTAARLNHPHILALHDSGEAAGSLYYVMPYVEGESLRARIKRERQLPVDEAVTIASQVASALDYAHRQGVIHRDIKPENILLHRGAAVVADFGIALAVRAGDSERLTGTGLSLGTPQYMSPEQATGSGDVDARSDVYSLGAVLYEMVTGEPPHTGATVRAIVAKLLSQPPVEPRVVRDTIPPAVDQAIMRALAKAPADRFAGAAQFATALTAKPAVSDDDVRSVVVLPFENLSPDPDNAFFADGLTEELISELSGVRQLRVISRTTAMRFKDSEKDVPAIARELRVRYVLEGSVRRAGRSMKITAQLIDARTDSHLWVDRYTGTLDDIFDLQERLARRITDALQVALTPDDTRRIATRRFEDFRAYDALLRARHEMSKLSKEGIERATYLAERAQEIAGDNALVQATLARCYSLAFEFGIRHDRDTLERADRHASQALALAPDLGLALFAKAHVLQRKGDLAEMVRLLRRARDVDAHPDALTLLAGVLAQVGRLDEARAVAAEALLLDPFDVYTRAIRGWVDFLDGQFGAAVSRFQELVDDPTTTSPHLEWVLAQAMANAGRLDEARARFTRVATTGAVPVADLSELYCRAADGDRRAVAMHMSEKREMVETARTDELFSLFIADCLAMIGDEDGAIEWLGHAIDWGFCNTRYLEALDPALQHLRASPRFQERVQQAREKAAAFETGR